MNAFDGSLVASHGVFGNFGGGSDLIVLLARRNAFLRQLFEPGGFRFRVLQLGAAARDVGFRQAKLSFIFHDCSFRLSQRFAEWTGIDLEEKISSIDVCSFGEPHSKKWPGNLSLHFDSRIRFDIADGRHLNGHGFLYRLSDADRNRRKRRSARLRMRR